MPQEDIRLHFPVLCPALPLSLLVAVTGNLSHPVICPHDKLLSETAFLLNWGGFLWVPGFKKFQRWSVGFIILEWNTPGKKARGACDWSPNIPFKATPPSDLTSSHLQRFHHPPIVPQAGKQPHNPLSLWGVDEQLGLSGPVSLLQAPHPRSGLKSLLSIDFVSCCQEHFSFTSDTLCEHASPMPGPVYTHLMLKFSER